jgi:WD40 repeat protein
MHASTDRTYSMVGVLRIANLFAVRLFLYNNNNNLKESYYRSSMSDNNSAARVQRASALEDKRKKLEDLKKKRALRDQGTADIASSVAAVASTNANASANLDDYIDGLLSQPAAAAAAASPVKSTTTSAATGASALAAATDGSQTNNGVGIVSASTSFDNVIAVQAAETTTKPPAAQSPAPSRPTVETFTTGTQTEVEDFPEQQQQQQQQQQPENLNAVNVEQQSQQPPAAASSKQQKQNEDEQQQKETDRGAEKGMMHLPKLLSSKQVEKEVSSTPNATNSFSSFINTASKKVERVLGSTELLADLLVNHVGEKSHGGLDSSTSDTKTLDSFASSSNRRFVSSRHMYECYKWTSHRDVTDLDWSPWHRELFLSTYHMPYYSTAATTAAASFSGSSVAVSAIAPQDHVTLASASLTPRCSSSSSSSSNELQSDGLCLIWNLTMASPHARPEHVFTCGSPVTSGRFHAQDASLVLGGCASGQLVIWDVRAGRLPVQKSAPPIVTTSSSSSSSSSGTSSSKGHVHPITCMQVIEGGVSNFHARKRKTQRKKTVSMLFVCFCLVCRHVSSTSLYLLFCLLTLRVAALHHITAIATTTTTTTNYDKPRTQSGLVTSSPDGRVNFWSLANLREPAESVQVSPAGVCCFAVAPESEALLLGDEQGGLHALASVASLQQSSSGSSAGGGGSVAGGAGGGGGRAFSRKQVRKLDSSKKAAAAAAAALTTSTDGDGSGGTSGGGASSGTTGNDNNSNQDEDSSSLGHYGMVTSISTKMLKPGSPLRAAGLHKGFLKGLGGLVLTSGVDWTVKLWSPASSDAPLLSMVSHSYDYMCDVKWNPGHPSLFATASSNGTIGLWNLAVSLDEPITGQDGGIVVEEGGGGAATAQGADASTGTGSRSLNKLQWSADGRRLAVASGDRVHVLLLADDVVRPKGDEESQTMEHLAACGLLSRP